MAKKDADKPKLDLKKARQKQDEMRAAQTMFYNLRPGETEFRILPFKHGKGWEFFRDGGVHFNVSASAKWVLCPAEFKDAKGKSVSDCPICELVDSLRASGDLEDAKLANNLSVARRTIVWADVIEVVPPTDRGVRKMALPPSVFSDMLSYITDEVRYAGILDFEEGRNFIADKSGTGRNTQYSIKIAPDRSAADPKAIDGTGDLFTDIPIEDYDKLKAILEGEPVVDEEPEEKSETPSEEKSKDADVPIGGEDEKKGEDTSAAAVVARMKKRLKEQSS